MSAVIRQDIQSGRWRILCRDGSLAYFYRAVMEAHLGRSLRSDEQVHHVNGDCSDDRIENLRLIDPREHGAHHARESWVERKRRDWCSPWSEMFAMCMVCGTTQRPHVGRGLCNRCNSRIYARARRMRVALGLV